MQLSHLNRRSLIKTGLALPLAAWATTGMPLTRQALVFPGDAGAHTDFLTEWWYVTGYANGTGPEPVYGFQVTFFRRRLAQTQSLQSRLAAKQLLLAHAAVTDIAGKRLWHDQRLARWSGRSPGKDSVDVAWASEQDTAIDMGNWSLKRESKDLRARVSAGPFSMDLLFVQSQPVLLQGDQGLSRKGPQASQASYYYSLPHLQTSGTLALNGKSLTLGAGSTAWLDHEWSNELLHPSAVGWDWMGINLFDGSALTAFVLRDAAGQAVWAGGSLRTGQALTIFQPGEVGFQPLRRWRSTLTGGNYPVEWLVSTPGQTWTVRAVVDNQELDSRRSTGAVYWEGLCEVSDRNNRKVGRGYLEMTGYASPLKL